MKKKTLILTLHKEEDAFSGDTDWVVCTFFRDKEYCIRGSSPYALCFEALKRIYKEHNLKPHQLDVKRVFNEETD